MPKFAANLTWMFHECDFLDRFTVARKLNFEAVECQFPYAWNHSILAQRQADSQLQMVMFNTPPGNMDEGEYGIAALPGREREFKQSVLRALLYAEALNCKMLHVLAGITPRHQDKDRYCSTYLSNLNWAAEECEKSNVTVLVEPINTFERPGYLITTTAEAANMIRQADSTNVAMQYDFHNAQLMEGNLTAVLASNVEYIRHMQIAGVPGRTPPDRGEMNYQYLFELVDKLGYQGWLGCEFQTGDSSTEALSWARNYGIG